MFDQLDNLPARSPMRPRNPGGGDRGLRYVTRVRVIRGRKGSIR